MATFVSPNPGTNLSRKGTSRIKNGSKAILSSNPSRSRPTSALQGTMYDVFLSFRGVDTRNNFVCFLYNELVMAGVRVFMDSKEIRVSEEIHPTLMEAIDNSIISIPVFSKDYASSRSCLIEVAKIYECRRTKGQIVLPIFFEVEPSDVRNSEGTFMESFRKHQYNGVKPQVIKRWREALREIGNIKGFTVTGDQAKLVRQVVSRVSEILRPCEVPVREYLVGMDQRVKAVAEKLQVSSRDVRMVGICGMHGIGKTTLAKVVYNKFYSQFHASSFISNVQQRSRDEGLPSLQRQLITELLNRKFEGPGTFNNHIKMIQNKFRNMRVLIVLDDVECADHLEAFVVSIDCFGLGSRIILTTRTPELLDVAKVAGWYNVEAMDKHDALQLFYWHAFEKHTPEGEYRALSAEIASNTGGIPLVIELIGSQLSKYKNSDKKRWEEVLQKLRNCDHEHLKESLRISYNDLTEEERQIYLDIACFLAGESNNIAYYMWKDCEFYPLQGIEKLLHLSLVKIGEDDKLLMSNPGREFGRKIVLQENADPEMRSRLWIHDEALEVLRGTKGTDKIKAICLQFDSGLGKHLIDKGNPREDKDEATISSIFSRPYSNEILEAPPLTSRSFTSLRELRFLKLDRAGTRGDFRELLKKLRWLIWQNCSNISEEVENLYLENLVILDLSCSNVLQNWRGWDLITEKAKKLKVLLLARCNHLYGSPIFPNHTQLEVLNFEDCSRLRSISIPPGTIKTLVYLNIKGCSNLTELPRGLNFMVALEKLNIDGTSIREFNAGSHMKNLQFLSACGCKDLRIIDDSIGELQSLLYLALDDTAIAELPNSIGSLTKLQTLSLRNCREVKELPNTMEHMKSLIKMDLSYTSVTQLPPSVEGLKSLQVLVMEGTQLSEFPKTITKLRSLEKIDFSLCICMKGRIPDDINSLSSLKNLMLSSTNISTFPSNTTGLCQLQVLDLHMCQKLQDLPSLPRSLTSLCAGSHSMRNIPNLSYMTNLMELHLVDNTDQYPELPTSGSISKPWPSDSFGWITNLLKLETLELHTSKIIELPPVFSTLQKLRKLVLSWVHLICLPGLPSGLTTLHLRYCKSLCIHEDLSYLTCLSELELIDCAVESINLRGLSELQVLEIYDCGLLKEIIGIQGLICLKRMTLSKCPQFRRENLKILQEQGLEIVE